MCTVSYINSGGKIIITSNRDEDPQRQPLLAPKQWIVNNKKIFFPKEPAAGGTWYAVDEFGNVAVLLNGAAEKHVRKTHYRMSRGLIVLEFISSASPVAFWDSIVLEGIEPFTIVLFENNHLYQLQWDGNTKSNKKLNEAGSHIWSSSTLYSPEVRQQREIWFREFLASTPVITEESVTAFHRFTHAANTENGLIINRPGGPATLSITQTVIEANKVYFSYLDLMRQDNFTKTFLSV